MTYLFTSAQKRVCNSQSTQEYQGKYQPVPFLEKVRDGVCQRDIQIKTGDESLLAKVELSKSFSAFSEYGLFKVFPTECHLAHSCNYYPYTLGFIKHVGEQILIQYHVGRTTRLCDVFVQDFYMRKFFDSLILAVATEYCTRKFGL